MLQHIHWATFVNSAFFSKIFKFQTDLVMAIGQTFSGWCIKQRRQFTSKQNSSLPKKCRKIRFWDWYWKCCQRAQKDSKVVQKRFWDVVLTWKRHSFTFQTHNFNLLTTILRLIFEASKCSIFWVWKELLSDVSKIKKSDLFLGSTSRNRMWTYNFLTKTVCFSVFSSFYCVGKANEKLSFFQHFLRFSSNFLEKNCRKLIQNEPFWKLFWALPVGIVCGHTTFWPKPCVFQCFQASIVLEKLTKC